MPDHHVALPASAIHSLLSLHPSLANLTQRHKAAETGAKERHVRHMAQSPVPAIVHLFMSWCFPIDQVQRVHCSQRSKAIPK